MKLTQPKNFPIVFASLREMTPQILKAGEKGMRNGLQFARTVSNRQFMRGPRPRVLGEVTGRLVKSVEISTKITPGKGVVGTIGSNVKYARYHEFGFVGTQNVREHTRHNAVSGARTVKFIREQMRKGGKVLSSGAIVGARKESVQSAEARGVVFVRQMVGAHTRRINYAGRPFIKPALVKSQAAIKESIVAELNKIGK